MLYEGVSARPTTISLAEVRESVSGQPALAAGSGSDLEGAIRYGGGRWRGMPLAPRIVVYADAARRQLPK